MQLVGTQLIPVSTFFCFMMKRSSMLLNYKYMLVLLRRLWGNGDIHTSYSYYWGCQGLTPLACPRGHPQNSSSLGRALGQLEGPAYCYHWEEVGLLKNQNKNKFLITGIKSAVNFMTNHDYITEIYLIIPVKILKHARYLFTHAGNKMTQLSLLSTLASWTSYKQAWPWVVL